MFTFCDVLPENTFSSPEAALLLVSTKNRDQKEPDLWGRECGKQKNTNKLSSVRSTEWKSSLTSISFPESSFPLTSSRKTRALGATILK